MQNQPGKAKRIDSLEIATSAFTALLILVGVGILSSKGMPVSHFAVVLQSQHKSVNMPSSAAAVYDWLIGDWEVEVHDYEDGREYVSRGEWHFSWVLEGRAIQDVWIVPTRTERNEQTAPNHNRYGTTRRIYDPKINAWRVFWFNPVTQDRAELIGRRIGDTIVQQSISDEPFNRWIFEDLKANSFVWRGESSNDGGKSWQL